MVSGYIDVNIGDLVTAYDSESTMMKRTGVLTEFLPGCRVRIQDGDDVFICYVQGIQKAPLNNLTPTQQESAKRIWASMEIGYKQ